jgi:predicted nucleic-acid-binding protein
VIGLDTNVLVRYLAQDDRAQAGLATRLIEGSLTADNPGFVSVVVLAELVWVLESCYETSRSEIASLLERMLRVKQLQFQDADAAWQALRVFREGKSDYADCLIERIGNARQCEQTVTFDQAAARGAGMRLLGR